VSPFYQGDFGENSDIVYDQTYFDGRSIAGTVRRMDNDRAGDVRNFFKNICVNFWHLSSWAIYI
jgi:hypothetical protein